MSSIIPSVFPINNDLAVDLPFCDWLSFTVPLNEADFLVSELDSTFSLFGATRTDNLYRFHTSHGFGTCKIDQLPAVFVFSFSGAALAHLRLFQLMNAVLYAISQVTHKITRLDVACDFNLEAYKLLPELYKNASQGTVQLTRKFITQRQIKKIFSFDRYGQETGTLYLGHRASSDVSCRVYDKAHELYQKANYEVMPRLRIEFTFKGEVLPTLRDVDLPSDIFYHHARHSLVKPPLTHKEWVSHGYAYFVEKTPKKTPYARMRGLFDYSADIEKLCAYAVQEFGETAPYELAKLFKQRVKKSLRGMGWNPMQASLF